MKGEEAIDRIRDYLRAGAGVQRATADECAADIARAASVIAAALSGGGKILLCGNGGSAADCQHMAAEFMSRLTSGFQRPGIAAVALTSNSSLLTAHSNDVGFESVFARQVETLGKSGDVLIAISTSGGSQNVLQAARAARALGVKVVTLTGSQGPLSDLADVSIRIPSRSTQHIQEVHLAVEHILCHLVERALFETVQPREGEGR